MNSKYNENLSEMGNVFNNVPTLSLMSFSNNNEYFSQNYLLRIDDTQCIDFVNDENNGNEYNIDSDISFVKSAIMNNADPF